MRPVRISGERIHRIILAPVVSEKSSRLAEKRNQAVFKVLRDAQKPEIKQAVEKLFNVKVEGVRTLNVRGKKKARGVRPDWKKAYVTLAAGQEIDVMSSVAA